MSLPSRPLINFVTSNTDLASIILLACIMVSTPALPDEVTDESLPPDHGYMLIHFDVNERERVDIFALSEVDTGHQIRIYMKSFKSAGVNKWMALVAAPTGRYYWSEYEASSGISVDQSQSLNNNFRRRAPSSADDTFEIASVAVNYVGNWRMRVVSGTRRRIDPLITYETSTLQRFVEEYPELVNEYPIFLSMMGKEAISLAELAKIMDSKSE